MHSSKFEEARKDIDLLQAIDGSEQTIKDV